MIRLARPSKPPPASSTDCFERLDPPFGGLKQHTPHCGISKQNPYPLQVITDVPGDVFRYALAAAMYLKSSFAARSS